MTTLIHSRKRVFRESDIEGWCKQRAKNAGWWVRKFVTPARASAPDDIFAKSGRVIFGEFKATGKIATPLQLIEHEVMRAHGLTVYVWNSREAFLADLEREEQEILKCVGKLECDF